MKILHFTSQLRNGSPTALAADLACTLPREETENIILAPAGEYLPRLKAAGVQHIPSRRINMLTAWREIRRMRQIIRQHEPDIIQVYTPDAAWVTGMACRKLTTQQRPRIVGVLSSYPRLGGEAVGWRYCDVYTAISKHLRNVVQAPASLLPCKPWVIPYGVNTDQCYPGYAPTAAWLEQWHNRYPFTKDERFCICVPAPISPLHGLEDIAPILAGLLRSGIPAHVFIVGDTRKAHKSYLEKLRHLFSDTSLAPRITWLGATTDLRDVLCASHAALFLSREPATWNRIIPEALALGCPVVAYDHGAAGEYLEGFLPEGRVAPGNVTAVVDVLNQWRIYPPSLPEEVPYPYRLTDTANTYLRLYNELNHNN